MPAYFTITRDKTRDAAKLKAYALGGVSLRQTSELTAFISEMPTTLQA